MSPASPCHAWAFWSATGGGMQGRAFSNYGTRIHRHSCLGEHPDGSSTYLCQCSGSLGCQKFVSPYHCQLIPEHQFDANQSVGQVGGPFQCQTQHGVLCGNHDVRPSNKGVTPQSTAPGVAHTSHLALVIRLLHKFTRQTLVYMDLSMLEMGSYVPKTTIS